nr:hypothetical protein [Nitrosomonas nitrosa]
MTTKCEVPCAPSSCIEVLSASWVASANCTAPLYSPRVTVTLRAGTPAAALYWNTSFVASISMVGSTGSEQERNVMAERGPSFSGRSYLFVHLWPFVSALLSTSRWVRTSAEGFVLMAKLRNAFLLLFRAFGYGVDKRLLVHVWKAE